MADIQIVYWAEGSCDYNCSDYCMQCHTGAAEYLGCKYFFPVDEGTGDCSRANIKFNRKGWTGKNYEMEEFTDPYNLHLDHMKVTLGRKTYDCVKVVLDGKCIYNNYDEEEK